MAPVDTFDDAPDAPDTAATAVPVPFAERREDEPPLRAALAGDRIELEPGLSCYVAGQGAPLLLVHSINAAASAAEVRPLFEHCRKTRMVFALDLPGYGFSDRSDRAYTPRTMTDALHAAAAQIRRIGGGGALDALAVSLSCEFLARAAAEQPGAFGRLALVSPTGLAGHRARRSREGATYRVPGLHPLLARGPWAERLFQAMSGPKVIRHFLRKTFGRPDIDEAMWAYAVHTARQPGARHAPLQFMSGGLFSADIHRVYEALAQPVWFSHGVRGDFTNYRAFDTLQGVAHWRQTVFLTGAMPYFEVPREFTRLFDGFLAETPALARAERTAVPRRYAVASA